jgi:hypothetical protein
MCLAAGGLGVSIVSQAAESIRHEGVEIRRFLFPPRQLAIAWRADGKSPALGYGLTERSNEVAVTGKLPKTAGKRRLHQICCYLRKRS